ncbi:MAG TPA: esterase-like activity of phytase family protein [Candidatus Eisenbacteria bacterium]|nr:esterase-like activity of phytase family protein [Candidatus Eisenbacteria bacterium]
MRFPRTHAVLAAVLLAAFAALASGAAQPGAKAADPAPQPADTPAIALTPVGRFDFVAPSSEDRALSPEELSGIAWIEGSHYIAIGDEHATMHRLEIDLDHETGRIKGVHFEKAIPLRGEDGVLIPDSLGSDREGIEFNPENDTVCISNEHTGADQSRPSIACHRMDDGRTTRLIRTDGSDMMKVFSTQRLNGGFESITRRPDGGEIWTANEMPLTVDSEPPSDTTGAVVRLQKFDAGMKPVAQYAYRLDAYPQKIAMPPKLRGYAVNGLSELLMLPGGILLALERTFAGDASGLPNLRIRIYQVDIDGATDVSGIGPDVGLHRAKYMPASKRLLWEKNFGLTNSNFEGMAIGPQLRNGDLPLILVADNNGGDDEAFYSLRISGLAPREASAPRR